MGSSDTAIAITFGLLGTIINILGILIAYLMLRAMNIENHASQPSPEEPRPQQLVHVHKHTHTFDYTDAENDIARRGVRQYWWERS